MHSSLTSSNPSAVPVGDTSSLTLIVLTNFFPAARQAIRYAAGLAVPIGARLVLLHVQAVSVLEGELLPQASVQEDDLRVAIQALAQAVYAPTTVELVPDLQLSTVIGLSRRYGPALFVLGRAAVPEREDDVTIAMRSLLRSGDFPLLVVPESYNGPFSPIRVTVAADGDPFELKRPVAALQLMAHLHSALTVVRVEGIEDDQACAAALRYVQASGLAVGARYTTPLAVRDLDPAQGLLTAIIQTEAQLLVLIARRRSFLSEMFHRSVTGKLLANSPVPLLVLPAMDS